MEPPENNDQIEIEDLTLELPDEYEATERLRIAREIIAELPELLNTQPGEP